VSAKSENAQAALRKNAAAIIVVLVFQYVFGMLANLFVKFPDSGNVSQYWEFARSQEIIDIHLLLGFGLLIAAVSLLVRSIIYKNQTWRTVSIVGVLAIAIAIYCGISFIPSQSDVYSLIMSLAFIAALVVYFFGLYLSRI
jgi:heme A synthase